MLGSGGVAVTEAKGGVTIAGRARMVPGATVVAGAKVAGGAAVGGRVTSGVVAGGIVAAAGSVVRGDCTMGGDIAGAWGCHGGETTIVML